MCSACDSENKFPWMAFDKNLWIPGKFGNLDVQAGMAELNSPYPPDCTSDDGIHVLVRTTKYITVHGVTYERELLICSWCEEASTPRVTVVAKSPFEEVPYEPEVHVVRRDQ